MKAVFKYVSLFILIMTIVVLVGRSLFLFILWATGISLGAQMIIFPCIFLVIGLYRYFDSPKDKIKKSILWIYFAISILAEVGIYFHGYYTDKYYKDYIGIYGNLHDKWGMEVPEMTYNYGYDADIEEDLYGGKGANGDFILKLIHDWRTQENEFLFYDFEGNNICIVKYELTDDTASQTAIEYIRDNFGDIIWSYDYNMRYEKRGGLEAHIRIISREDSFEANKPKPKESHDEYTDLGLIYCYTCGFGDNDPPRKINGTYHLFVKSYDGDKYYFIGQDYDGSTKYPVTKGSWTKSGERFNGIVDHTGFKWYMNVSAWPAAGSGSSSGGNGGGTVVIEHSGPRQEWVQCTGCNGSGMCQNCNGTGRNLYMTDYRECVGCGGLGRCGFCAGQGGHYETRY